ncbi:MAG: Uncharacterized protein XE11_0324 [Methanomicrobiales archaeon 53_19]|jgi:hypothetical protein|uniref:hypothetical protein n=1 Tax=Methanocalculus sp. TaxID=2004547 RepID=UPI0007486161|nr:hypothetical protein [Methanocalculus sp.]KUK71316.1 MAG: Uncharacterized protein XD88_0111 [Methanocalculus sp. 52_23]KUL04889.1 MAG: Uncharacterized protein XE11_0324 [Methanomicrobiales archaeon 53_19]HIJ06136.1 hypothetical protein [Methanocalculus sp.]
MNSLHYLLMGVILAAVLCVAGCSDVPQEEAPPATTSEATPAPVVTSSGWSLEPGPVGTMPAGKDVSATARKDPLSNVITVQFDGGRGMTFITQIQAILYSGDGRVEEKSIERPLSLGKSVTFEGTRGSPDRVKITAIYNTGEVVVISDELYQREDAFAK